MDHNDYKLISSVEKRTWNWKHIVQNVIAAELVIGIFIVFWYLVTYYHYRSIMDWYQAPNIYIEITVEKMMQPGLIGRALLIILAGIIILVLLYFTYLGIIRVARRMFRLQSNKSKNAKTQRIILIVIIVLIVGVVIVSMNQLANIFGETQSKLALKEAEYHTMLYKNGKLEGVILDTFRDFYIVGPIQNNTVIPIYELVPMKIESNPSSLQIVDGVVQNVSEEPATLQVRLLYTGKIHVEDNYGQ
ncbi:hypothetical protein [Shimazuella alba]|uniref:Uncharacterized protein n=1 Tax=Shimazuella alba TaxID=2690964 RepID=A0A6I4VSZ0_9BACL|nr:hypothetical protein [Shimazuella alba]MXQ52930.1 hypothetical protein [Shimazuella alba]